MKVRVKWIEDVCFLAETDSGHAIVMDGAPEGGGRNLGPRPMETVLAGLEGIPVDIRPVYPVAGETGPR